MPYGQHFARCFECGKDYLTGDCITHECPDCERKREKREETVRSMSTDTAEIKMRRFRAYQRGFGHGAGMMPMDEEARARHVAEYDFGYRDGKEANRAAMRAKAIDLEILVNTVHALDSSNDEVRDRADNERGT